MPRDDGEDARDREISRLRGELDAVEKAHRALTMEHARALDEHVQSENLHRQLFESGSDGILLAENGEGRILRANSAVCRLYGYSRDELLSMSIFDLSNEPGETRRLTASPPPTEVVLTIPHRRIRKKDGTTVDVEITARFFELGGQPVHIASVRDITARVREEEERRALEAQVLQAQKLESLWVMAGGVAHDFNNILMAIMGYAELAREALPRGSPGNADLDEIVAASQRAAELVKQLLAYAGKGRVEKRAVRLDAIADEIARMLEVVVSKKADLVIRNECEAVIEADPAQMRQIVMNLVTNASEALGDGEGLIRLSTGVMDCDRATLDAAVLGAKLPEGRYGWVEAADTGCGMDATTAKKIFEPFFSTKFTGRGLGLAALHGIVRAHRGAITVKTAPEGGTTIRVLLPAAAPAATRVDPPSAPEAPRARTGGVLLVDDEEVLRLLGVRILQALGWKVWTASDGVEAVAEYRARRGAIALVILDLKMPRMDGREALEAIRAIDPAARVVIASGQGEEEVLALFEGVRLEGRLQKPFTIETLHAVVEEVAARP